MQTPLMPPLIDPDLRPGLLVSVRNAAEAVAALAGGADVIDVKEPNRGSLGAADPEIVAAIIQAVDGRAPVTAAAGELIDLVHSNPRFMPHGLSLFKIGLAGCRAVPDWPSPWSQAIRSMWPHRDAMNRAVAVAYADWQSANAPEPSDVLRAAIDFGCPAVLVDTWDKSAGTLFDHWPPRKLAGYIESVQSRGLKMVLAGSLAGAQIADAARLRPELIAVRAAACEFGRGGKVSQERVAALRRSMADLQALASQPTVPSRA